MSWRVMPKAILDLTDVTAMDSNTAGDTVRLTGAETMLPRSAVMALVPAATEVAKPLEPAALLMVATDEVAEAQVT